MTLLRNALSSLLVVALLNSVVFMDDAVAGRRAPGGGAAAPKRTNRYMVTVEPSALEGGDTKGVASTQSAAPSRSRFKALQSQGRALVAGVIGDAAVAEVASSPSSSKIRGLLSTPTTFVVSDLSNEQVAALQGTKGVKEVSPVYTFVMESVGGSVTPQTVGSEKATPLFHENQWGVENVGNLEGDDLSNDGSPLRVIAKADVDADLSSAWRYSIGSSDLVVAVIDTGVDPSHPNLKSNLFYRTSEIGGNKIDDDQNGYVDDVHGVQTTKRTGDVTDTYGHGTHVTGIVAASPRSDGDTMTGASPDVRFLTVATGRSVDGSWSFDSDDLLEAFRYVLANKRAGVNIRVLNLSLGGDCAYWNEAMKNAVKEIVDAGITVVAAAGNSGRNNDVTPTCPASIDYPGIISVGNVAMDGNRHWSSNYGKNSVDVAAPGGLIYSTIPRGRYYPLSGTSQASPLVAGIAALMLSVNPTLTPKQVQSMIVGNVKPLSDFPLVSGGLVSAQKAVIEAAQSVVSGVVKNGDKGLADVVATMTVGATTLTIKTNARGEFFFARPPVGVSYALSFSKPLFTFSEQRSPNDKLSTLQRFTISANRETRKVSGTITVNGQPAAGVRVGAYAEFPDNQQFNSETTTDARGSYVLAVPFQNKFFLFPSVAGVVFPTKPDGYVASGDMTVNFTGTFQAISVRGSVATDGRLAADIGGVASLSGSAPGGAALSLTAPVRAGRFEFFSKQLVAGGTYTISLSGFSKKYGSVTSASVTPTASISVGLQATQAQTARRVVGQITSKGAPVVGASVSVFELVTSPTPPKPGTKRGELRIPRGSSTTDAKGGFSIPVSVLAGTRLEVVAESPGLSFAPVNAVAPAAGDVSLKLSTALK